MTLIIAVEEFWLNGFDVDTVVPQSTVASGACMLVVDGVFGIEFACTGAACTAAVGNSVIGTTTSVLPTSKDKTERRPDADEPKRA